MAPPLFQRKQPFSTCPTYHSRRDKPTFSPTCPTALSFRSDSFVTMATKPASPNTTSPSNKTIESCYKALMTPTDSGISTSTATHPLCPLPRNSDMRPTMSTNSRTKGTSSATCIRHAAVQSHQPGSRPLKRGISPLGPASPPIWSENICPKPSQPPRATNEANPKASNQLK
jgi:hypothetical protein